MFLFVCYSFTLGSGFDYPVMFYALAQCPLCFVCGGWGEEGGGQGAVSLNLKVVL